MYTTHLHLAQVHFPIIGSLIGIAILIYGIFSKNLEMQKVAFVIFIVMSIATIPVFLTGGEAEETVESLAGVSEPIIEDHEELAEKAIWLMGLLGVLSLIGFLAIITKRFFVRTMTLITLVVSLGTFGVFTQVANLGGQIRHTEIRAESNINKVNPDNFEKAKNNDEDED